MGKMLLGWRVFVLFMALSIVSVPVLAKVNPDAATVESRCRAVLSSANREFNVDTYALKSQYSYLEEGGQIFSFLSAHSATGRYVQVGSTVWKAGGITSGEFYASWKDATNTYRYTAIGNMAGRFEHKINLNIWSWNNGTWGLQVNDLTSGGGFVSPSLDISETGCNTILAAVRTTGCSKIYNGEYWTPCGGCEPGVLFENAWYRENSGSTWYRWPSCLNEFTSTGCSRPGASGTLESGNWVKLSIL